MKMKKGMGLLTTTKVVDNPILFFTSYQNHWNNFEGIDRFSR